MCQKGRGSSKQQALNANIFYHTKKRVQYITDIQTKTRQKKTYHRCCNKGVL